MTDPKFIGPPQKLFKSSTYYKTMPEAKTATEIGKDIIKKTNVGAGRVLIALGSPILTSKKLLSKAKAKFTGAAKRVKDISSGNISGKAKAVKAIVGKAPKGTSKALVTKGTARLFKAARFARAATPVGLATVALTSIKKRDPKAVKREREFFKGKKYKDYGFESMLNYKGGGLKEATKKLKAQGYN